MKIFLRTLAVAAMGVLLAACPSAPVNKPIKLDKVDKGPGTITEARKYLEGRWTLMSMDLYPPGQAPIHGAASGNLVYDDYGNMKVYLQLNEHTTALAEHIGIPAPNGVVSTEGRTVIDVDNHAISYVLEGQDAFRAPTHPLDLNRPRYWETAGNVLTLRTKDQGGNVLSVTVWRKETGKY